MSNNNILLTDQCFQYFTLDKAIIELQNENKYQIGKFGIQTYAPFRWLAILSEEVGELAKAILKYDESAVSVNDIIDEAIQVATLSLKISEMYKCLRGLVKEESNHCDYL